MNSRVSSSMSDADRLLSLVCMYGMCVCVCRGSLNVVANGRVSIGSLIFWTYSLDSTTYLRDWMSGSHSGGMSKPVLCRNPAVYAQARAHSRSSCRDCVYIIVCKRLCVYMQINLEKKSKKSRSEEKWYILREVATASCIVNILPMLTERARRHRRCTHRNCETED